MKRRPLDKAAVILTQIALGIETDEIQLSDEARFALSLVSGAVARQDKRLGKSSVDSL